MKTQWSGKLSGAKSGWLIALLFFGWLAFLFVPGPKPESQPAPSPAKPPPSRLVALGLPDDPDLEHLPELFGLYADQAEWKSDKTIFAYWNPGSNSYSYFFEASKKNGNYRFRPISKFEAYRNKSDPRNIEYEPEDYARTDAEIAAIQPITDSSIHPLVLFKSIDGPAISTYRPGFGKSVVLPAPTSVPINLKVIPQPLPKMEIKNLPIPNEPAKK